MHRVTKFALVGAMALHTGAALAGDGLDWRWSGPRTYLIQSDVTPSNVVWIKASFNKQFRMQNLRTNLLLTCQQDGVVTKRWVTVRCKIDDVAFAALSYPGDAKVVVDVLDDVDAKLTGRDMVFEQTMDGRLRSMDLLLDDDDVKNDRMRETRELVRMLLQRSVASLDLQLPAKGDSKGARWRVNGPMALGFISLKGSMGGEEVWAEVKKKEGMLWTIDAEGGGVIGPAEMIATNGAEQPANLYNMVMQSSAVFDVEHGNLVSRQHYVRGDVTPSSQLAGYGAATPYEQSVALTMIEDGQTVEPFGPNVDLAAPKPAPDEPSE